MKRKKDEKKAQEKVLKKKTKKRKQETKNKNPGGVQSLHSLKNPKDLQILVVVRSTTWALAFRNEGPILGSGSPKP